MRLSHVATRILRGTVNQHVLCCCNTQECCVTNRQCMATLLKLWHSRTCAPVCHDRCEIERLRSDTTACDLMVPGRIYRHPEIGSVELCTPELSKYNTDVSL